ncbi:ATP-binding protein [Pampinifervens florentissimum]|uniref:ATP-binding protein n=1 Tax=Pampinifervens florentissimum TaxID=1632019 RepID=UPI0013B490A0|nr:ATP-binding protein [Hydrogenobacter sp. T-8]QID32309.1 ATP-binding protein [Hydrogenobacter sp. T-8]
MVARNLNEVKEMFKDKAVLGIYEQDTYYDVVLKDGVRRVKRVIPLEHIAKTLIHLDFPKRIVYNLKNTQKTDNIKEVVNIIPSRSLILTGQAGTGKTHAVVYTIAHHMRYHRIFNPLYVSMPVIEDFKAVRSAYKEADIVVLDDVNRVLRDYHLDLVKEIIYYCYNELKKIVIITNLTANDLLQLLADEPIASRLREMCVVKTFKGQDLRLQSTKSYKGGAT